ncbi:hypothetical protein [Capsulimonas corticalis]|uniref:hypothetical protein n=1 Tax=Capsulimonas corticalis TaxID=2219043 RepID=UPI000F650566|nr:hypothetical protein [Capsulimonas corticalis]
MAGESACFSILDSRTGNNVFMLVLLSDLLFSAERDPGDRVWEEICFDPSNLETTVIFERSATLDTPGRKFREMLLRHT